MTKKNKTDTPDATNEFLKNKIFIMTRPNENSNGLLKIQTESDAVAEEELNELYHTTFFDYLMNLSLLFNEQDSLKITSYMCPILAYQFFLEDPKHSQLIIDEFIQEPSNKKYVTSLNNMPDNVSQLCYILSINFKMFAKDYKKLGLEKAIGIHHGFYIDIEETFFNLPACFCFNLIDLAESLFKK